MMKNSTVQNSHQNEAVTLQTLIKFIVHWALSKVSIYRHAYSGICCNAYRCIHTDTFDVEHLRLDPAGSVASV